MASQQSRSSYQDYFEFRVRQAAELTEQRILAREQVLRGARGLFNASHSVTRREFATYVASLRLDEHYPGILGVGYATIVRPKEKNRHIAGIRRESGHPEYLIWPEGQRDLYTSIIYLEPFSGRNLRAFGYDMYSEPVRRTAMDQARDTGVATLSGKVLLVQETEQDTQAGFLIYLPVYRNDYPRGTLQERRDSLLGWVYSPLRMNDLARGMYGERANDLDIEIYDGLNIEPVALMYDSDSDHSHRENTLNKSVQVQLSGRIWTLNITSTRALEARFDASKSSIVGYAGSGLSVLFSLLSWILLSGRRRALSYAEEMTRELRKESEKNLALLRNASDGIHILDTSGNIVEASDSFCAMLGYKRSEVIGMNVHQWDAGLAEPELTRVFNGQFRQRQLSRFETKHRRKDGTIFDVEVSGLTLELDGRPVIFESSRDISARKASEAALQRSLSLLTATLESTNDAMLVVDLNNTWVSHNRKFLDMWGIPNDVAASGDDTTALSTVLSQLEDADGFINKVKELYDHPEQSSFDTIRFKDGKIVERTSLPQRVNALVVGRVWSFRDVTEKVNAEDALRKSEAQLTEAQSIAKVGSWQVRFGDEEIDDLWTVSDELKRIWGYADCVAINTRSGFVSMHPEDKDATQRNWESAKQGKGPTEWEHRIIANGAIKWIQVSAHFVFDERGRAVEANGTTQDITERKLTEEALRRSDALFRSMAETLPVAIYVSSGLDQVCDYLNPTFVKLFGYDLTEVPSVAEWWPRAYPDPVYRQRLANEWQDKVQLAIDTQSSIEPMETVVTCKDGSRKHVHWGFIALGEKNFAFGFDLTERKAAEQQLRIAATAFDAQEGMTVTDEKGNILRVNQAFSRITGYSADEVVGKNPRILKSGRQSEEFYIDMWQTVASNGSWEGEIWNRRKNGEAYAEYLTITAVKDEDGTVTNYVGTFNDITRSKLVASEIENLAFFDPLTRLPNRRLLLDRLSKALASIKRSGAGGALLFLDLDHFKNLNDTLGHDIGDLLLNQVAERLTATVREGDTVARLGGDEFVVMLEDLSSKKVDAAAQAEGIATKIMAALNQPYQLGKHLYNNSPSIGITLIKNHDQGIEDLLKQADIAMYQSKKAGRNTISFFDPGMQHSINTRVALETDMWTALEHEQFSLQYQIQVNSVGQTLGAEALIRWQHPSRGLILPAEFIPLAEEAGLILPIGTWVMETACKQLQAWQQNSVTRDLKLSVNVSARQFHQTEFVSQVRNAVNRHCVNPSLLKLELTESLLLLDIEDTVATMNYLKEIGIEVSLDDFGTGFSSLQYLNRLPIYQLKIDQSFVRDIAVDGNDRKIVQAIIAMANNLGLNVIAEGVETEEQQTMLIEDGCNIFQGYLFGRPMPIEEFEANLKHK